MLYYKLVIENNIYKTQRVNDRGYRDNRKITRILLNKI